MGFLKTSSVFAVSFLMGKKKPRTHAGLFVFWLLDLGSNQGHTD